MKATLFPGLERLQAHFRPCSPNAKLVHRRPVGFVLPAAMILALFGTCIHCGSVDADCIDYGDYLHWVAEVETPAYAFDVAVVGSHAYIATTSDGLQIVDIADPERPEIVGGVDTPGWAYRLAVSGTHAYVADNDAGLQVIDITDPENPQIVGSVDTPSPAKGVAVVGTHAYVADGSSGLLVIDITTPGMDGIGPDA